MKKKFIVVCQTPPPFLGQSLMHKYFVEDIWSEIDKVHIRTEFTKKSSQFGKLSFAKVAEVFKIFFKLIAERIKGKIDLIYYPPSGPANRKTFYKDLAILSFLRFFSRKFVFHFHADKFDRLLTSLSSIELIIARLIYGNPELCIIIVDVQKDDLKWIKPKKIVLIENGIEDVSIENNKISKNELFKILYIGLLIDYKGIEDAIESIYVLKKMGYKFVWTFVGGWSSQKYESIIKSLIDKYQIEDYVCFTGEINGPEKWNYFNDCDIMCLPTRNDLMPLCILESMMFAKPIITTKIRSLSYIVDDNVNGLLCERESPGHLAEKISELLDDRVKCERLGYNARMKYEERYTIQAHLSKMKKEIMKIM
jgi:glycosyltransferase involved in cell wall biosynthesis